MEKLSDLSKEVSEYLVMRDHYLSNAEDMIKKNNLRKASELLWGAVTQTIKSLASLSNIKIVAHKQFRVYIKELNKEIKDESILDLFSNLERLHENFYDEIILEEDFPRYYKKTVLFIKKLDIIAIKKIKEEPKEAEQKPEQAPVKEKKE